MITSEILKNKLQKFPRYRFAHLPTPLEKIERLGSDIGTTNLWVKREDTTGLVLGGNKARHYEFEIPHIIEHGGEGVGLYRTEFQYLTNTTEPTEDELYEEYKKAIEAFNQSLQVNVALTEAHYHIAQIQLIKKDTDSALKSIESAIKASPANQKYREFREKIIN